MKCIIKVTCGMHVEDVFRTFYTSAQTHPSAFRFRYSGIAMKCEVQIYR